MSDFLTNLAARSTASTVPIAPRLPSRFESGDRLGATSDSPDEDGSSDGSEANPPTPAVHRAASRPALPARPPVRTGPPSDEPAPHRAGAATQPPPPAPSAGAP